MTFLGVKVSLSLSQNRGVIGQAKQRQSASTRQQPNSSQQGTDNTPLVVKVVPTPKTQEQATQEANDRNEKSANDRHLVDATLVLAAIGILQLLVFGYQAIQLRRTVVAAAGQSAAMERSINEANRLASAMEKAAKDIGISASAAVDSVEALRERTAQQMRAYVSVIVGTAIYQERDKDLKFEGRPFMVNTGHTPAHGVSYRAKAAVLPVPLPDNFGFPLPVDAVGSYVLGASHNAIMNSVVDDFFPDNQVEKIKKMDGNALFVWGLITYKDIFDIRRETKFCQQLYWLPDGKVFGIYVPRHNDAT
ncbi:MAG TPA: hypothetical protein VKR82_17435 [Candidatus Acidoferrales bacterium]|nr:hypothetical protein [Candidatus Acidoferrales bacterium]